MEIPARMRRVFREEAPGWTLREIDAFWQDEGFIEGDAEDVAGERRSKWLRYEAAVDWTDSAQLVRVLRVFENVVPAATDPRFDSFRTQVARDGFDLDERGRLRWQDSASPDIASAKLVGGRYRLDDAPVGEGGFGQVYFATDTMARFGDPERVALKRLLPWALEDGAAVSRFRREIRIGTTLRHPSLMPVLDVGEEVDTGDWYVTPIADGGSLWASVRNTPFDPDAVLDVMRSVASGVQHLHTMQTLHRDLSPGNVLKMGDRWVLSDFGLSVSEAVPSSLETSVGVNQLGTRAFCAPEQLASLHSADERSDVFGLGKLLQYVTEAHLPYGIPSANNPARSVILKATATDPEQRYSSVTDFMAALEVALAPVPTSAESNADRADRYEAGLRDGRLGADSAREVLSWLTSLDADSPRAEQHIIRVVTALSPADVKLMWAIDRSEFMMVLRKYSRVILAADLGFNGVDRPARFLFSTDRALSDPEVRLLVVSTLARLGQNWNRYLARNLLIDLLNARPSAGVLLEPTVSGLRESEAVSWVLAESDPDDFPAPLRGWLRSLLQAESE